ncbi:MAG: hypothetical protein KJO60_00020 [Desulfofustis sp.]|nr:hypothetical protein [Desulfofustis sp.]NNK57138.1 hypothetical protein [Desulfofustis sp.]
MKKKSAKLTRFIEDLHKFIVNHPQFRNNPEGKSEVHIQTEIRPIIIQYLEKHFKQEGYKDHLGKAHESFYWEGQEGILGKQRAETLSSMIVSLPNS